MYKSGSRIARLCGAFDVIPSIGLAISPVSLEAHPGREMPFGQNDAEGSICFFESFSLIRTWPTPFEQKRTSARVHLAKGQLVEIYLPIAELAVSWPLLVALGGTI